jgi:hypothetical protein
MIRHDDPRMEKVSGVVEVQERARHGGCIRGIAEQAGAKTLVEQADRNRIREAEREEIRGFVLLPAGETVSGLLNLRELIEEFQSRIGR